MYAVSSHGSVASKLPLNPLLARHLDSESGSCDEMSMMARPNRSTSVCLSVNPSFHWSILHPSIDPFIHSYIYITVCLVCMPICLSMSIWLFICICVLVLSISVYLYLCLSCLYAQLSVYLCISIWLFSVSVCWWCLSLSVLSVCLFVCLCLYLHMAIYLYLCVGVVYICLSISLSVSSLSVYVSVLFYSIYLSVDLFICKYLLMNLISHSIQCSTTGVTSVLSYRMVHIKVSLLLIRKSSPIGGTGKFPLSYLNGP